VGTSELLANTTPPYWRAVARTAVKLPFPAVSIGKLKQRLYSTAASKISCLATFNSFSLGRPSLSQRCNVSCKVLQKIGWWILEGTLAGTHFMRQLWYALTA
ncbi:hypothetical protein MMC29_003505, partial [Sticta canariensis]|nr:hypothetical protein [Sticta canariensis]